MNNSIVLILLIGQGFVSVAMHLGQEVFVDSALLALGPNAAQLKWFR
jgi:hypothetical protein